MNYRQWKKNYKKIHGVNPPLSVDKRKQRKIAQKVLRACSRVNLGTVISQMQAAISNAVADIMQGFSQVFGNMATVFQEIAEDMRP